MHTHSALVLKKVFFLVFNEIVVNLDYLVLEKVILVVKQSNLVPRKKLFGCRKNSGQMAKQFILVLDSVYFVVQKFIAIFYSLSRKRKCLESRRLSQGLDIMSHQKEGIINSGNKLRKLVCDSLNHRYDSCSRGWSGIEPWTF